MNEETTVDREWYVCWFRLDERDRFALWYRSNVDGFELAGAHIPTWRTAQAASEHGRRKGYDVSTEPPDAIDLDLVQRFIDGERMVDPRELMHAWNSFTDAANTLGDTDFLASDRERWDEYNHLFYLCDTAATKGTDPDPTSALEDAHIRQLLALGLKILREALFEMDGSEHDATDKRTDGEPGQEGTHEDS